MDESIKLSSGNIFISFLAIIVVILGLGSDMISSQSYQQTDILLIVSSLLFLITLILSFVALILNPTDDQKFHRQIQELATLFNFSFVISIFSVFVVVSKNQLGATDLLMASVPLFGSLPIYFWPFFVTFSFLCIAAVSKQYSEKGYDELFGFLQDTILDQVVIISCILLYSISVVSAALVTGKLSGLYVLIYIIVLMVSIIVLKNYRGNQYEFN